MPQQPVKPARPESLARCFGLRIESQLLQLAIASPLPDGRWRLEIDQVDCSSASDWLTAAGSTQLVQALAKLAERHDIRRHRVAVSLDGDFCVTRVKMGTAEEVDRELSTQADRIPRYLQLGPGEKVTGGTRLALNASLDYAVTGVVNRTLIELIYEALRDTDVDVRWVEPSLVSIARLVGEARVGGDEPIMIGDGTGRQWDVGIACGGRLLLDYRPAAATNESGFRDALDGHISRLKRFCLRRRGVVDGDLNRLLLCGSGNKPQKAVQILGDSLGVTPEVFQVPEIPDLYEIDPSNCHSSCVPAVATVLPLLTGVSPREIPDLLSEVRRAPEQPWRSRLLRVGWPAMVAASLLFVTYAMVANARGHYGGNLRDQAELKAEIEITKAKFSELARQRELLGYLNEVAEASREGNWDTLLRRVAQSLPNNCLLNEYRVEPSGMVVLDATVLDDSGVYEVVNNLRRLPSVTQVALKGTAPEESVGGTRFVLQLTTQRPTSAATEGGSLEESN